MANFYQTSIAKSASHFDLMLNIKCHKSYKWNLEIFSVLWLYFISKQGQSKKKSFKLISKPGAVHLSKEMMKQGGRGTRQSTQSWLCLWQLAFWTTCPPEPSSWVKWQVNQMHANAVPQTNLDKSAWWPPSLKKSSTKHSKIEMQPILISSKRGKYFCKSSESYVYLPYSLMRV